MVTNIDPGTLEDWLSGDEPLLVVDIRTEPEYELGHVPGSVNVPLAQLATRLDSLDLPRLVVVVCEVGELSVRAGRIIEAYEGVGEDHTVASLDGGYRAWKAAEATVEADAH